MTRSRRQAQPLDQRKLEELALRYVGRFATSRAKLVAYLRRKMKERGWSDPGEPDLDRMADDFAQRGYIDDAAYADAKARSLAARGYGPRRLELALRIAGIEDEDAAAARQTADTAAAESALRFARRRRLGPFGVARPDLAARQRSIATMVRAGHSLGVARAIVDAPLGVEPSPEDLTDSINRK